MSTIQQILKDSRGSMDKGLDAAKREFASVRSGKASPNMLDTVRVEMYGQQMMLNQVASIGPVTSATAREHGLAVAIEARRHDIPGLVEAVRKFFLGKSDE